VGTGVYNISGGTVRTLDAGRDFVVGHWDNSNGTLNVRDSGAVVSTGQFIVGNAQPPSNDVPNPPPATGLVEQRGGTVTVRNLIVGNSRTGTGTYNLTGGTFRQTDVPDLPADPNANPPRPDITPGPDRGDHWNRIGANGTANFNISGGTLRAQSPTDGEDSGGNITVGQWDNSNGTLNISGTANVSTTRDFNVGNGQEAAPSRGTVAQTGGTVTVGRDLNIASGNAAQQGSYTLSGGTLDMTGGTIRKGADDTFAITGATARLVNVGMMEFAFAQGGGTFNPGPAAGPGSTTLNGGYSLTAGVLEVDVLAPSSGDVLNVTGPVTLAGTIDLLPSGSFVPDQSFLIIQNDGADPVTGAFLNAPPGAPFADPGSGSLWRVSYTAGDGNDVALTVVPEPATAALAALAAAGLMLRRRRPSR
jgi:hypothetical protein